MGRRDDRLFHGRVGMLLWKPDDLLVAAPMHLPGCLTLHIHIMGPESCLYSFKRAFSDIALMSFYTFWKKKSLNLLGGAMLPRN